MIHRHISYNTYCYWRFQFVKAQGDYIWDDKNRKIIDFTSGWNVTNLGWNHPEVTEAVIKQAKKNTYAPMWTDSPVQDELAEILVKSLPRPLNYVIRATGGTEANEEAIKIARAVTGRKKIIGFRDTYHGQSFATMALGYRPEYVTAFSPLVPDFIQIEFPGISYDVGNQQNILERFLLRLEEVLSDSNVAAIVAEAGIITGWGSLLMAPKGFLTEIRALTQKYGTLLILDEVGTGFGRLGKLYGMQIEHVVPDIVTLAKGLSNGAAAIGAAVVSSDVYNVGVDKANLTSTFGWTPIACAASAKSLEIHQRDKTWTQVEKKGELIQNSLKNELSDHPNFGEVRGIGLEIGLELIKDKKTNQPDGKITRYVIDKCLEKGLHITGSLGDGVIQIMPPLTISLTNLNKGIDILVSAVKSFKKD